MSIRPFVVVVGVLFSARAWADKPPALELAIKQAASAHKPLVIEFGAAWCGPCKIFEAKVLPDISVQAALEGVTFVRYDVDEDPGDRAAQKLKVTVYPTFVVLDAAGVEIAREQGLLPPKQFIALIDRARREAISESDIRASLKQKPDDVANLLTAAQWFALHSHNDEAIAMLDRLSVHKQATTAQRAQATAALLRLRRMQQWKAQLAAEKVAFVRASLAAASEDDILIATIGSNLPAPDVNALFKGVFDATEDLDRINHLVYVALAAKAYDPAVAAAQRLVAKKRNAQYLDTLAECYHAGGDRKRALATEDEAIAFSRYDSIAATLNKNRARFASGGDEASIVQLRSRAVDLWKRVDQVDQVASRVQVDDDTSDTNRSDEQRAYVKQFMAQQALARAASKACATEAAGNEDAVARIVIADGVVKSAVLLLEPTATKALRDCLTKQILGAKFDAVVKVPKVTLMINFATPRGTTSSQPVSSSASP